ncbi:MAG TPA: AI-2E family transporter [Polyangiales bacterium]
MQRRMLGGLAAALALCAFLVIVPCSVSLILASWVALLTRPFMLWLSKRLHGRTKAAAVVTSLVVIGILGPIVLALIPLVSSALQLANEVGRSHQWHDAARSIIGDGAGDADLMKLVRTHFSTAWGAAAIALRTSANVLFNVAMFIVALFALSTSGEKLLAWLRAHSPLKLCHFDRLADTYAEIGRSLIIGVGATALIQGLIATLTYVVVGIPRALALGLLTTIGALIPGVGTLLVWGPVTVILGFGGYPVRALVVGLSGAIIIGSVDNFLKPILSNRAHLGMPAVLVFISMLSGIAAFGPAGLLLGPLFVRLAMETLAVAREEQWIGVNDASPLLGRAGRRVNRAP